MYTGSREKPTSHKSKPLRVENPRFRVIIVAFDAIEEGERGDIVVAAKGDGAESVGEVEAEA